MSSNLPIEGQRGIIYDRNHEAIVENEVAPSVIVIPSQVTDVDHNIGSFSRDVWKSS